MINPLSESSLLGKKKFTKFFVNEMPNQSKYFLFDDLRYIYFVDEAYETIYFEVIK